MFVLNTRNLLQILLDSILYLFELRKKELFYQLQKLNFFNQTFLIPLHSAQYLYVIKSFYLSLGVLPLFHNYLLGIFNFQEPIFLSLNGGEWGIEQH